MSGLGSFAEKQRLEDLVDFLNAKVAIAASRFERIQALATGEEPNRLNKISALAEEGSHHCKQDESQSSTLASRALALLDRLIRHELEGHDDNLICRIVIDELREERAAIRREFGR